MKKIACILIIPVILWNCAASYRPIKPTQIYYQTSQDNDNVNMAYHYDVIKGAGNKKYANKEDKRGAKLIAVKITNNREEAITIGQNANVYSGNNQVQIMSPKEAQKAIEQIVPAYLPYALFCFMTLNTYETETTNGVTTSSKSESYPIGLIIGPALTIGNMALAGSSNKKLLAELEEYNILGKTILPGQSIYGIIGVRGLHYAPLKVAVNN